MTSVEFESVETATVNEAILGFLDRQREGSTSRLSAA
jgi:hypothetical protein